MSLQFVIPATVSLLAQVAPQEKTVWRIAFSGGAIVGAVGIAMLAQQLWASTDARIASILFAVLGLPLYVLVGVVAWAPTMVAEAGLTLKPIEVEGMLFSLIVFLGVQEAWVVSMTPVRDSTTSRSDSAGVSDVPEHS